MFERFSWLLGKHYQGRGRKPKLSKKQKKRLFHIVENGPEKWGFDCGVRNSAMILEVIEKEFNTTFNPRYLCEFLKKKIGLTYQKVKFVSVRLDDEAHQKKRKIWESETWPEILKKANKLNGIILFHTPMTKRIPPTTSPKTRLKTLIRMESFMVYESKGSIPCPS